MNESAEHTRCCKSGNRGNATTSNDYRCHVDGEPCEVVALFVKHTSKPISESMAVVEDFLPCDRCRAMEVCAANLPGIRLGKHERRILQSAPPPRGDSKIIEPDGDSRSADEANRRAIRKLHAVGLVDIETNAVDVETKTRFYLWSFKSEWRGLDKSRRLYGQVTRAYNKRAVWLSPLGQAVVASAKDELSSGKPIRWANHWQAASAAAREDAATLLSQFKADVQDTKERCEYFGGMAAMCGNSKAAGKYAEKAALASDVVEAIKKARTA